MQLRSSKLIAHARIPVLKLELKNGLELDVSLNDTGGIRAANFLQSWVGGTADQSVNACILLLVAACTKGWGMLVLAWGNRRLHADTIRCCICACSAPSSLPSVLTCMPMCALALFACRNKIMPCCGRWWWC